MVTICQR